MRELKSMNNPSANPGPFPKIDSPYDEFDEMSGNIRISMPGWDETIRVIRRPVPWTPNQGLKFVPPHQPQTAVGVPSRRPIWVCEGCSFDTIVSILVHKNTISAECPETNTLT